MAQQIAAAESPIATFGEHFKKILSAAERGEFAGAGVEIATLVRAKHAAKDALESLAARIAARLVKVKNGMRLLQDLSVRERSALAQAEVASSEGICDAAVDFGRVDLDKCLVDTGYSRRLSAIDAALERVAIKIQTWELYNHAASVETIRVLAELYESLDAFWALITIAKASEAVVWEGGGLSLDPSAGRTGQIRRASEHERREYKRELEAFQKKYRRLPGDVLAELKAVRIEEQETT